MQPIRRPSCLHLLPLMVALVLASPAPAEPVPAAILAELPMLGPPDSHRITIDLAPPGRKPMVWLLDTGANLSVMTPLTARAAGVSIRPQKRDPYRVKSVLGRDVQFHVDTKSSDTGSRTGWEYGLLGGNFLAHYVVELDFERRVVRFYDEKKYRVPEQTDAPGERVIPMKLVSNRPGVEIELDGQPLRVLLDTGAPHHLVLSGDAARQLGIDVDALPSIGSIGTVMGQTEARLLETDALRFAGFSLGPIPVIVLPRGAFNQGGSTDSVIGLDALSRFRVVLDYPRKRIWLRERRD